jgi:hypothetical protein
MEVHHTVPNCEVRGIVNRYKLVDRALTVFR